MDLYGLIGKQLSHSWSEKFFTAKFEKDKIRASYKLFPLATIELLPDLIQSNPGLKGLNVTIPYKRNILPYLDAIEMEAKLSGSVNTILIKRNKSVIKLIGYNTDIIGFTATIDCCIKKNSISALVLGTGGASKSVQFVLRKKGISYTLVSRESRKMDQLSYKMITNDDIASNLLIINTSPVGMFPDVGEAPAIPFEYLTKDHILIDLIYNPETTLFLQKGKEKGAKIMNGLTMLHSQAEASWKIWNKG
jgi:shikimate dehydrogenase